MLFARVEIGVTNFLKKTPKEKSPFYSLNFFKKQCIPGTYEPTHGPNFHLAADEPTFGGKYNFIKQMLAAAFKTMVKATRNHVGEFLSCGRFAVESITEDPRKQLGPMPMTSMTYRAVVRTRPRSEQARLSAGLRHSVKNPWRQARHDHGLDYDARRVPRGTKMWIIRLDRH